MKREIEKQVKEHERLVKELEAKLKEQEKKNLYSGIGALFYPNKEKKSMKKIIKSFYWQTRLFL